MIKSIFRWILHLLIQLPVDLMAYVIVPIAVKKSWRDVDGKMRLPVWAKWYDDPSHHGNEGEPFWRNKFEEHELYKQMCGWLLRNKAYRFRIKYIDPTFINPTYKLWGDQYIDKSTGRTGWLFATAEYDGKTYWNFAAVIKIYKNYAWQPYVGWGFKRAKPLNEWSLIVTADHSASLLRFTDKLQEPSQKTKALMQIRKKASKTGAVARERRADD